MRLQETRFLQNTTTAPIPNGAQLDGTQTAWAASTNSAAFFVGQAKGYSLMVVWPSTGSPNGTFTVQASNDNSHNNPFVADEFVTNWVTLDFPAVNAVGTGDSYLFEEVDCMYRWIRLVWTRTSGSVTPSATIQFKGVS